MLILCTALRMTNFIYVFHIINLSLKLCAYIKCSMLNAIVCIGYCDEPMAPANGGMNSTGNMEGDTVTYFCNEGYNLSGDANRTCQSNGSWSGILPKCDSTFSSAI